MSWLPINDFVRFCAGGCSRSARLEIPLLPSTTRSHASASSSRLPTTSQPAPGHHHHVFWIGPPALNSLLTLVSGLPLTKNANGRSWGGLTPAPRVHHHLCPMWQRPRTRNAERHDVTEFQVVTSASARIVSSTIVRHKSRNPSSPANGRRSARRTRHQPVVPFLNSVESLRRSPASGL